MINVGRMIRDELCRQGHSAGWLAKELECNRSTVYRYVARNSIDTAILAEISQILKKDFFKMISEEISKSLPTDSK